MPAQFIADDIPVFFSEFAQTIVLDGSPIPAVVESAQCSQAVGGAIERCDIIVHCKTADIPVATADRAGSGVVIDGKVFSIVSRSEDLGVTEFRLVRGRGY